VRERKPGVADVNESESGDVVLGIGLDLCPSMRIDRAVARHGDRFLSRVFTDRERAYCLARHDPSESFAARFAAKEAASKALGGSHGLTWHDVEVLAAVAGQRGPTVMLRGRAQEFARERGIRAVLVSMTHAAGVSAAVVLAIGKVV